MRTTRFARRRFSASDICRAMAASISAWFHRRRARRRAAWTARGAETTMTKWARRSPPVSNSSGTSSTTARAPARRARARKPRSAARTSGCTMRSRRLSAPGSPITAARRAARSMTPSRTVPGNDAAIGRTARPPGRCSACTAASASNTGIRARRKQAAAVDLPMPMPPVSPITRIPAQTAGRSSPTKRRSASSTSGSTPNQAAKPGRAWCRSMPSPPTATSPRVRAAASRLVSRGT